MSEEELNQEEKQLPEGDLSIAAGSNTAAKEVDTGSSQTPKTTASIDDNKSESAMTEQTTATSESSAVPVADTTESVSPSDTIATSDPSQSGTQSKLIEKKLRAPSGNPSYSGGNTHSNDGPHSTYQRYGGGAANPTGDDRSHHTEDGGSGTRRRRMGYSRFRRPYNVDLNLVAIDYKKPEELRHFLSERGKILPRRFTKISGKKQRQLSEAVKRARILGLLPFR